MSARNRKNLIKKLASLIGVMSASSFISWPVVAQYYYGPSFFTPGAYFPTRGPLIGQFKQLGFNKLAAALNETPEIEKTLNQGGPFTILAPTDEAFDALPAGTLEELMKSKNKQNLAKLLSYHVIAGTVTEADLAAGQVKTVEGSPVKLQVNATANELLLNDAKVTDNSFNIRNGKNNNITFVAIDKVLMPPDLQQSAPATP
ncbi:MAG: fasciclin domain-containing protein [Microcoleus vaginatus WJT46-NPBG5]|jgi:uncharacterized surface protein with fasciclin (FAS1) repeats|nr:fasciclin domain-containing protein [Microcoleus vaginatus WJT46-NPBG5]